MNLVLIYPKDPSITFLDPIHDGLIAWSNDSVKIIRPDSTEDSIAKAVYEIDNLSDDSTIFFMGHGASNLLHANIHEDEILMDLNIAKRIFYGKNLISISCRSSEFIANIGALKSGLGFGHLPTELDDIETEIEASQFDIAPHHTAEVTQKFNKEFVSVLSDSIKEFIANSESMTYLRKRIILRVNKVLDRLDIKNDHDRLIGNILYQVKKEMSVIE